MEASLSAETIPRWGEQPPPEDEGLVEALFDDTTATPYPMNEELNFKVVTTPLPIPHPPLVSACGTPSCVLLGRWRCGRAT